MRITNEALTYDDILLLPLYSEILPRDVNLKTRLTRDISINIPLLAAAMDTVTEGRLAIALAEEGGIGFIHKNMTIKQQVQEVRMVKRFESGVVHDPITIHPSATVAQLLELTRAHNISGLPVVDDHELVGIVTNRDFRFEADMNKKVASIMTPKQRLVTVREGATKEEVINLFCEHRIEKVLVVDNNFHLRGLFTVRDLQKARENPNACRDDSGQLRVGAAVGVGQGTEDRVTALIEAGTDVILVDTAHGHSKGVIQRIKWIKRCFPSTPVIGGNIATGDAAIALADAGVDGIKVGIGPGSICTTRVVTGIGVPQVTAIMQVAEALKNTNIPIIADGGIRFSGDISKAIACGADSVMIGSLFAGTKEAPGEVELYQGRTYKSYRGMGSLGAMAQTHGSSDRYFQESNALDLDKLVPEGIEGRVPYKGSISGVIQQLIGGLCSAMGYTGSANILELQTKAQFTRITLAGVKESHVHDVMITKQAPNYMVD